MAKNLHSRGTTFGTIETLENEVARLTKALEQISKCSCGGYVMGTAGYVNGCAASGIAKRALKQK